MPFLVVVTSRKNRKERQTLPFLAFVLLAHGRRNRSEQRTRPMTIARLPTYRFELRHSIAVARRRDFCLSALSTGPPASAQRRFSKVRNIMLPVIGEGTE